MIVKINKNFEKVNTTTFLGEYSLNSIDVWEERRPNLDTSEQYEFLMNKHQDKALYLVAPYNGKYFMERCLILKCNGGTEGGYYDRYFRKLPERCVICTSKKEAEDAKYSLNIYAEELKEINRKINDYFEN